MFSPRARGCSVFEWPRLAAHSVFPACAGMFRAPRFQHFCAHRFPRVRGDVPIGAVNCAGHMWFSPRARGCSVAEALLPALIRVFPACAGMFRVGSSTIRSIGRFPRVRGDVPMNRWLLLSTRRFSPRARGCSSQMNSILNRLFVFPACAGMFPRRSHQPPYPSGFPRVRGDVPALLIPRPVVTAFSPRTRGCSHATSAATPIDRVFPACAGMFPSDTFADALPLRFPRARGDVPRFSVPKTRNVLFSPRTRGCSDPMTQGIVVDHVFPAHAGMFPLTDTVAAIAESFPRARGDVPARSITRSVTKWFSPRTRGCSMNPVKPTYDSRVFPAHAGMFPRWASRYWDC